MKPNRIRAFALAFVLALAACGEAPTGADVESARLDEAPVCEPVGFGGHTLGGGNYKPGPCP